jgi:type II secretory pathway component HofQ
MSKKILTMGRHPHIIMIAPEVEEIIKKNEAKQFAEKRRKVKLRKLIRGLKHPFRTTKKVVQCYPAHTTR